jgi:hypothetical protein
MNREHRMMNFEELSSLFLNQHSPEDSGQALFDIHNVINITNKCFS